jgi:hypothetical protein
MVFFTQLLSDSAEMREGIFYYLMMVQDDPTFVLVTGRSKWSDNQFCETVEFIDAGGYAKYPAHGLIDLSIAAAQVCLPGGKRWLFLEGARQCPTLFR